MALKKCDLLIVNHNTRKELERLLTTLDGPGIVRECDVSIVVQDNGSEDDSIEYVKNNMHLVNMFIPEGNVGYSKAINRMASITDASMMSLVPSSEYIAALNGDVWLTKEDVAQIIEYMEENPDVAVVSPKQMNEQSKIVHAGIIGTNTKPRHRGWMVSDPDDRLYKDIIDCVTVSGSAYFMRRSVWNEVVNHRGYQEFNLQEFGRIARGGFLETPHYWEETFYSYFVRHLGYRVVYNGQVSIGHTWHASTEVGTGHDRPENIAKSRDLFRRACDFLGMERD